MASTPLIWNITDANLTLAGVNDHDHELSKRKFIIFAVIIFTISLWIVCSNVLVIIAIVRTPKLRKRSGIFLGNLACADILCGILIPPCWVAGTFLIPQMNMPGAKYACGLSISLQILPLIGSIFGIILVAFERYIAIVWPLQKRSVLTKKRCYWLVFIAWVLPAVLSSLTIPWNTFRGVGDCDSMHMRMEYYFSVIYLCFWGMLLVLIYLYSAIVYTVYKHSKFMRRLSNTNEHSVETQAAKAKLKNDTKLCQLVLLVIGVFCACWIPRILCHTLFILDYFQSSAPITISGFLSYSNSGMNFILYAARSKDYRQAFWDIVRCRARVTSRSKDESLSLSTFKPRYDR